MANGNNKKVVFDKGRAREVFTVLTAAYAERQGIFGQVVLPQDRWPPAKERHLLGNGKELANWFFFVALPMRGGVLSEEPFKVWWELRKEAPELFTPELIVREWSAADIEKILKRTVRRRKNGGELTLADEDGEIAGYKTGEHADSWYNNAAALLRRWDGDARNIFEGVTDFEEAFARVDYERNKADGIKGMRRKIFSLLTIWLQEKKLIPIFPTPIPVDFHALRILWATEIVTGSDWETLYKPKPGQPEQLCGKPAVRVTEPFMDQVAVWSQRFLADNGFSHLAVNPALWFLSRTLCAELFQNSVRESGYLFVDTDDLRRNPQLWPRKYKNPCLYCSVERFCWWAIPSGPYYKWGLLIKIGERVPYPQANLFPGFWRNVPPKFRKNQF